jgi:hypothetical protein
LNLDKEASVVVRNPHQCPFAPAVVHGVEHQFPHNEQHRQLKHRPKFTPSQIVTELDLLTVTCTAYGDQPMDCIPEAE